MIPSLKWIPRSALRLLGVRYWKKRLGDATIWVPIDSVAFARDALFTRESSYLEALLAKIRPDDLVLDVGAHQGLFAVAAAQHAAGVIAFEPNSDNRRRLAANLRRNRLDNVEILPVAIGAHTSASQLWIGDEQSALTMSDASRPGSSMDSCMVVVVDIDSLGLRPQVMKIDIEGVECEALRAASRTLESCRCLGVEIHPPNLEQRGYSEQAVVDVLASQGFERTAKFDSRSRPRASSSRHHLIFERR